MLNIECSAVLPSCFTERNVNYLFPIQYKTFDHVYNGEDVIGQARTFVFFVLQYKLYLSPKQISLAYSTYIQDE